MRAIMDQLKSISALGIWCRMTVIHKRNTLFGYYDNFLILIFIVIPSEEYCINFEPFYSTKDEYK